MRDPHQRLIAAMIKTMRTEANKAPDRVLYDAAWEFQKQALTMFIWEDREFNGTEFSTACRPSKDQQAYQTVFAFAEKGDSE